MIATTSDYMGITETPSDASLDRRIDEYDELIKKEILSAIRTGAGAVSRGTE